MRCRAVKRLDDPQLGAVGGLEERNKGVSRGVAGLPWKCAFCITGDKYQPVVGVDRDAEGMLVRTICSELLQPLLIPG